MAQSKKKGTYSKSVEKSPSDQAINRSWKWSWGRFVIASAVIALIAVIIGVFYYQNNVAPFRRAVITVDDTTIDMGYFIKRARIAGTDPMMMLTSLTNEQLIKLAAPRYVGEVSAEDINQALRKSAQGESETISESEFKEWYRQQLNETGLSDTEYKEITRTSLLATRFHKYLAQRMPTVAEQIHLHAIMLETLKDAERIRARLEAGEDFADLAREVSLDKDNWEGGGDLGWFPRGVLSPGLDYVAFNLTTDNVSDPIPYDVSEPSADPSQPSSPTVVYYLLMVSEKADAREVDEDYLPALKDKAFEDWLAKETGSHEIEYNFNSEIYAWMSWQLQKK